MIYLYAFGRILAKGISDRMIAFYHNKLLYQIQINQIQINNKIIRINDVIFWHLFCLTIFVFY